MKKRIEKWIREAQCPMCGEVTTEDTLGQQTLCECIYDETKPLTDYKAIVRWNCKVCKGVWKEEFTFKKVTIVSENKTINVGEIK